MIDCTEDEIEMLARFEAQIDGNDIGGQRQYVRWALDGHDSAWAERIRAALRLMREARRQGAEEMREGAALACVDEAIHPGRDEATFLRGAAARIRALPLPGDNDELP